ncbi:hypothetical protein [Geothrix alkalitolerans]|uniref:hypothetical protein n=1 Tax=Geothrix alkalitolerans TaxID=2922724 RepID=UPI001FB00CDE|nr:hypothetical protein [Geothrix alkalitolerans]
MAAAIPSALPTRPQDPGWLAKPRAQAGFVRHGLYLLARLVPAVLLGAGLGRWLGASRFWRAFR